MESALGANFHSCAGPNLLFRKLYVKEPFRSDTWFGRGCQKRRGPIVGDCNTPLDMCVGVVYLMVMGSFFLLYWSGEVGRGRKTTLDTTILSGIVRMC